ncbi:MAG: cyclic nucleotide-binding domain-containing protein [Desulfobacteraceae bacterium]|nr:cyclic nucleotide-binding domain-containing protein [Desulfobacteraceae bacterium]
MERYIDKAQQRIYLDKFGFSEFLDQAFVGKLKTYKFSPGEFMIRHGEPADHLWFFVEGRSKVFMTLENGKSLLIRFYAPPEIVGDVEVFSRTPYICNMQALTTVACIGTPSHVFREHAESNPRLLVFMCRNLSNKLANFNLLSAVNQKYTLENRVAAYLAAVSTPHESRHRISEEINTSNLTELADLLGSSYRHLTRTLKKLKNDGIIAKSGDDFVILDRKRLLSMARDIYSF